VAKFIIHLITPVVANDEHEATGEFLRSFAPEFFIDRTIQQVTDVLANASMSLPPGASLRVERV
jgi:hypothetical protein